MKCKHKCRYSEKDNKFYCTKCRVYLIGPIICLSTGKESWRAEIPMKYKKDCKARKLK